MRASEEAGGFAVSTAPARGPSIREEGDGALSSNEDGLEVGTSDFEVGCRSHPCVDHHLLNGSAELVFVQPTDGPAFDRTLVLCDQFFGRWF